MDTVQRWNQTWEHLRVAPPGGVLQKLLGAYGESHRFYHTVQHLSECFGHLEECPTRAVDPGTLELAIWFHDAIYETKAGDSEAQSAAWMRSELGLLPRETLDRIEQLIMVTEHEAAPINLDQELLLDVDLSILGAPLVRFDEYEGQIRREYSWVPEPAYRAARGKILAAFLERPVLYHTPHFRDGLEDQARSNLSRSLGSLAV